MKVKLRQVVFEREEVLRRSLAVRVILGSRAGFGKFRLGCFRRS